MVASVACILCGREDWKSLSTFKHLVSDMKSQRRRLRQQLEALEDGRLTVVRLRQQLAQMCGTCQTLLIGISSEDDRHELLERVRKSIQHIGWEREQRRAA